MSELDGTQWVLASMDDAAPMAGSRLTLTLPEPGRVAGSSGVNEFFGPVAWREVDGVRIGPLGVTRMAGPAALMQQERTYVTLLQQVDRCRVEEDRLELLIGQRVVLEFERAEH